MALDSAAAEGADELLLHFPSLCASGVVPIIRLALFFA